VKATLQISRLLTSANLRTRAVGSRVADTEC
jgi:hypothetical protein